MATKYLDEDGGQTLWSKVKGYSPGVGENNTFTGTNTFTGAVKCNDSLNASNLSVNDFKVETVRRHEITTSYILSNYIVNKLGDTITAISVYGNFTLTAGSESLSCYSAYITLVGGNYTATGILTNGAGFQRVNTDMNASIPSGSWAVIDYDRVV